jgi:cation-dependent mannose-6-phosphate receptor
LNPLSVLSSLFVLVAVYFVGGILFNKYYRKMEGREVVPNVAFWADLPGLVKDGAMFIVNKARGRDSSYSQVSQQEY